MTPLAILKKARDHIAPKGMFWKGRFYKGKPNRLRTISDGPCCPVGALGWAAGIHPESFQLSSAADCAYHLLGASLPSGEDDIVDYSDHPTTTHIDIRSLFRRAIAAEETS